MPFEPLVDTTGTLARGWRWVRASTIAATGLASLIGVNALQTLSLALLPFSRTRFRRFNRWCASSWWGACVVTAERVNGTRLVVTGNPIPLRENAVIVSNHQQMTDITAIMAFARSKGSLGDLKFFVKQAIKWVPGIGWGMQFIDCVFVRRNWSADSKRIERTFAKLVNNRIPMWLVSFVEGTRGSMEKLAQSNAYARERGLRLTHNVLLPRTKGFVAAIQGLGEHVTAVYDVTIGYVEGVPTLWQYIKGSVKRVHLHVRRFPVGELPRLEHELSQWLLERFYEKDSLLEHFHAHGFFPPEIENAAAETTV